MLRAQKSLNPRHRRIAAKTQVVQAEEFALKQLLMKPGMDGADNDNTPRSLASDTPRSFTDTPHSYADGPARFKSPCDRP